MKALPVYGVPEGFDALLLARRRAEHTGNLLHIVRDDTRLARLSEALAFFAPDIEQIRIPSWDCLPYDRVSPNQSVIAERIAALGCLLDPPAKPRLVLASVAACLQRVPPRSVFTGSATTLVPGATLDVPALVIFLESNGYGRADNVMEPGEYAVRGGIVDLYPAGEADPVRIDLFGDQIESLRFFDATTQRSAKKLLRLTLRPVSEVFLDPASIVRFRTGYRDLFGNGAVQDPLYQSISAGHRTPGMEHYLPLFHETLETIFDYLPDLAVSFDHQTEEAFASRTEMVADHYAARKELPRDGEVPYRPIPSATLYLDSASWHEALVPYQTVQFIPFAKSAESTGIDAGGRPGVLFTATDATGATLYQQLQSRLAVWQAEAKRIVIAAWTRGSRERIQSLLREHGIGADLRDRWDQLAPGKPQLITLGLERGFLGPDVALISEQDLLGERISRPPRRRKRADQFIAEATEIAEGDLVVHQEHGIGRFDGLVTLDVSGAAHDCLRILYDGDDKLFLPVENIEMLSRFGSETGGIRLDKLGGAGWQNRKSRMKQRIRDMAGELIRVAAARKLQDADAMMPPEGAWDEFCARFPFEETEDQARAIADVIEDLASGKPMDRLICGDVGFGKTEVALRAAFIAAMSGTQVAVVVPTTLLARQHFRGFTKRFEGLGIKVAQLSRMVTAKDADITRAGLADGSINIVIGTHALLAKGISFAELGLLIVDEEQHFGVSHKEKLKQMKAGVHVLTLTATPIPRTLQLALTGVREMSVIATPPIDRLAVRTFIMPFDPVVIREAIARELFRGGQIFCVVPRLEDLSRMNERLRAIVPDARICEAHGRLSPTQLEQVMTEFSDRKHDILLSTNIVESGLDMPSVNTLIIHRADMFGLGQLYQLRGRVGRGKHRGYAYLTWAPNHVLSTAAEKRLHVMQTLENLGAGFTLASHDLDIRGAGNLLGDEQSGHIREVGIELYQQMLEDAVADLGAKGGDHAAQRDWTPNINLGLPVLIPEEYVRDLPVRLGLYRRIGALTNDAETDAMAAELTDRFGKMPEEVENLLQVMALKRSCREAQVERLEAGPKGMVLQFRSNRFANPGGLVSWLGNQKAQIRLRPDHKLALTGEMDLKLRVKLARDLVTQLARLARAGRTGQGEKTAPGLL
jgi:transcription-repair coupling factor (superfamily II helicase)